MSSNRKHSDRSRRRYGYGGEDVHRWMDEPFRLYGSSHRKVRHEPDQEIPKVFLEKYGEELARNLMLDHILYDKSSEKPVAIFKATSGDVMAGVFFTLFLYLALLLLIYGLGRMLGL